MLAKFAAMSSALFVLMALPLVVLYVGALLAKLPVRDQTAWRPGRPGRCGAVRRSSWPAIGLLIAAFTPRRGLRRRRDHRRLVVGGLVGATLQGIAVDSGRHALAG